MSHLIGHSANIIIKTSKNNDTWSYFAWWQYQPLVWDRYFNFLIPLTEGTRNEDNLNAKSESRHVRCVYHNFKWSGQLTSIINQLTSIISIYNLLKRIIHKKLGALSHWMDSCLMLNMVLTRTPPNWRCVWEVHTRMCRPKTYDVAGKYRKLFNHNETFHNLPFRLI